jgi:cysteine-rich repeat protein
MPSPHTPGIDSGTGASAARRGTPADDHDFTGVLGATDGRSRHAREIRLLRRILLIAMLVSGLPASAAVQTGGQQRCINAANGAARKLATAIGKEVSRCVKKAGRGKEPDAATCVESSARVAAARASLAAATDRACAEAPDFGFTSAPTARAAIEDQGHALVASLFGADPQAAMAVGDEAGARCQAAVTGGAGSLLGQEWKAAVATKKEALRTADDAGALADAVAAGVDGDRAVTRKTDALTRTLARSCAGASATALFPGACASAADAPALAACVAARVRCAFCGGFNGSDGTAIDCDDFDDALANGSCEAAPRCGDGARDSGEACDDGNVQPGDGCSATCQFEAVCGDGMTGAGEFCDDGNTQDGDGCSASCRLESCGDGALDAGEECDDGDTEDFDGCSAGCRLEVVFVSASGDDTDPGTRAAPKATLQAGVEAAQLQGYGDVFVAAGSYFPTQTVALRNGVSVTGGFDPVSWAPEAGTTQIFGPSEVLYVQGFNVPTTLQGLSLQAAAASNGDSSYGLRVVDSILLTIRGFTIVAGAGAEGEDGATLGPRENGLPGTAGGNGSADGTVRGAAGAGGNDYCVRGGNGGTGGAAGVHPGDTGTDGRGGPCNGAGLGGAGGPGSAGTFGVAAQPGTAGADGVAGTPGAPGAGGDGGGEAGFRWRGSDGDQGGYGTDGSGGGGGGGGGGNFDFRLEGPQDPPDTGAGGGGGGAGGRYGPTGYGGDAGTGSFGIYLYQSSVTVEDSVINTGPGGAGGSGGTGRSGGMGGAGGDGGQGAEGSGAGGRGGRGGNGGRGGDGGGGSGGVSFPILVGEGSALTESGNTLVPGPGGPGGGPNGADGDAGPIGFYPPLPALVTPSAPGS